VQPLIAWEMITDKAVSQRQDNPSLVNLHWGNHPVSARKATIPSIFMETNVLGQ
jgi:hypothetical protein